MTPWYLRYLPHLVAAIAVASAVFLIRASGVDAEATRRDLEDRTQEVADLRAGLAAYQDQVLATQRLAEKRAKTNTVIQTVTKEVLREVPVYVPADSPPLPGGWRVLHDAAARGVPADPAAPGGADADPVPAQDAAATVVENYGQYRALANDHSLLQEWVTNHCKR